MPRGLLLVLLFLPRLIHAGAGEWRLEHDVTVTALGRASYLVVHEKPYAANAVVVKLPEENAEMLKH